MNLISIDEQNQIFSEFSNESCLLPDRPNSQRFQKNVRKIVPLSKELADLNRLRSLEAPEQSNTRKGRRQQKDLTTLCQKIDILIRNLKNGGRLLPADFTKIQTHLAKIHKKSYSAQTRATIHTLQKELERAQEASIRQCLNKPKDPFEPSEIDLGPSNPQKGFLSTFLHVLNFQGSVFGSSKVYAGREKTPQQASAIFSSEVAASIIQPETCEPKLSDFQASAPQCVPLKTRENDLRQSLQGKHDAIAGSSQEGRKYGNKHLNLVKMEKADQFLDLQNLEIPAPKGFKSEDIEAFLQRQAPEVFIHWQALRALQKETGDAFSLDMPAAKEHLSAIQDALAKAFASPNAASLIAEEMQEWLNKLQEEGLFLMVRSTGAEDSHQTANAGGNVSRAYVRPQSASLMQAVGDVIGSYFSKNSLQNRLNAKTNPFQEPLQLSVTSQALIGETIGGAASAQDIPVSFVAFTNEPLYIGGEKFRAMRISLTYGHGEGVVSGEGISTDSALILHSAAHPDKLYITYDNQRKLERLAPQRRGDQIVLEKTPNPDYLASQPALSQKQIGQLYSSLAAMEAFFEGQPTDVEGVFRKGIFYFVQARPVNRKSLLPTYLKNTKGSEISLQAETIVPGKASVVEASDRNSILLAATLKEAEERFQADLHKIVIVQQTEPQNSHPVVNFSSLGIPCLYAKDKNAIEQLLQRIDATHHLAVCMQTATIHLWDTSKAPLETAIEEGFAVHPAQIAVSLDVDDLGPHTPREIPNDLKELIGQIRLSPKNIAFIAQHRLVISLKQNIETIRRTLPRTPGKAKEARKILKTLIALDRKIEEAVEETRVQFEQGHPAERLQKLLHLKILETLLIGAPKENSVGQYSLLQAETLADEALELIAFQGRFSHPVRTSALLIAGKKAASEEAYAVWKTFLFDIETLVQSKQISQTEFTRFSELVSLLDQTGSLPFWLTFLPKNQESLKTFENILREDTPATRAAAADLLVKQTQIKQMKGQIDRFADPESYAKAWKELQTLLEPFHSPEWLGAIKTASSSVRAAGYRVMEQAVDLLDLSLKTLKGSSRFEQAAKAQLFKDMLRPYFAIMRRWAIDIVPERAITHHENWPLIRYLDRVEELLGLMSTETPLALLPSRGFSVSAAVLTAGTAFERHEPQTLEDMLTLLHQNCLSWTSILQQELLTPEMRQRSSLPQALQEAIALAENGTWGITLQRIGMEIESDTITIHYNVPLRNHSGHVDLVYDTRSKEMTFQGQLLGEARQRWSETAAWAGILQRSGLFASHRPLYQGELELTFSWKIAPENLADALREYAAMAEYSLGGSTFSTEISNLFQRWESRRSIELMIKSMSDEAEELLKDQSPDRRATSLNLYLSLVEKGLQIETAIAAAEKGVGDADWRVQYTASELFIVFIEKGYGIEIAIAAAERMIRDANWRPRNFSLQLFRILVEKGHAIEAAIAAAEKGFGGVNPDVRTNALRLFTMLVEKGYGIEAAIAAAEKEIVKGDRFAKNDALHLFEVLIEKGHGIEAAIVAVGKGLDDADFSIRSITMPILAMLVEKGYGIETAIAVAEKKIGDASFSIRWSAVGIFSILIEKGYGIEAAIAAAKKGMDAADYGVQSNAFQLFSMLIEKGYGIEAAEEVAAQTTESSSFKDQLSRILTVAKYKRTLTPVASIFGYSILLLALKKSWNRFWDDLTPGQ